MTDTLAADTAHRDTLIARAREIRPLLQRNAAQTDSLRRLPDEVVSALRDNGLCRLMVPKRFGGYQTSIRTYIEVMEEIGLGCASAAWVASLVNVCDWLTGLFPERAQQDIWGPDRDAWIAGSLAPSGTAVPVDGGWRVSGRWPWASGSLHAQWVACGIHMANERGEICEGTITNIFADFGDGVLMTPRLDCGLLPGVLRCYYIRQVVVRFEIGQLVAAFLNAGTNINFKTCPQKP